MGLRSDNISKRYFRKSGDANYFEAVKPVSIELLPGTVTVLTGRSGSGKTTLLHMLAGLLTPDSGKVWLDGTDLYSLKDEELSRFRNDHIGVIPQGRSAVDTLTVLENILLPGRLYRKPDRTEEAILWMEQLDILHLKDAMPSELSGGELRRAAIARTLTQNTKVILADEPTGDLDDENTCKVLSILRKEACEEGKMVFLVTHENDAMHYSDRVFRMSGGEIEECHV